MATKDLGGLSATLGLDNKQFLLGAAQSKTQLLGLSKSLSSLAVPALVIGGTIALARGISRATDAAAKLEKSMANVATLVDKPKEEIKALTKEVQDMTTEVLKSSTDLSSGLYQVFSAGITDSSEAMDVLRVSAIAATAGLSDTRTSVDAITTVLNAYQLEAREATRVSDILFQTVRLGKTTYEELAGAIGTVIPIAATAGVELEDLFATIATLTKGGIQTRRATTALRSALLAVIKPAEGALEKAKELGLEFSSAAIRSKGFIGFLNDIREKTAGSDEAIAALIPNARALSGVMAAVGKQNAELNRIQDEFGDIAESSAEAFRKQADTVESQSARMSLALDKLIEKFGGLFLGIKKFAAVNLADLFEGINRELEKSREAARESDPAFKLRQQPFKLDNLIKGIQLFKTLAGTGAFLETSVGKVNSNLFKLVQNMKLGEEEVNKIIGGFDILRENVPDFSTVLKESFEKFPSVFGVISDSVLKETKAVAEKVIAEWSKVPDSIKKAFDDLGIVPKAQFDDIIKNTIESFEVVGRELSKRGELNADTATKLRKKLIDRLKGVSKEAADSGFIIDDEQIKQLEKSLGDFGDTAVRAAQEVTREINKETGALEISIKQGVFDTDKFIKDTAIEAINSFKDVGLNITGILKDDFQELASSHVEVWKTNKINLSNIDIERTLSFKESLDNQLDAYKNFAGAVEERSRVMLQRIRENISLGSEAGGAAIPNPRSVLTGIDKVLSGTTFPAANQPIKTFTNFHRGSLSVPRTGLAEIKKGELIVPAAQNPFNENNITNNFNFNDRTPGSRTEAQSMLLSALKSIAGKPRVF